MGLLTPFDYWRAKSEEAASYQLVLTSPSIASTSGHASDDGSYFSSPLVSDTYSLTDSDFDDDDSVASNPIVTRRLALGRGRGRRDPLLVTTFLVALGTAVGLFIAFPFPTTVHVFIGAALAITSWTVVSWLRVLFSFVATQVRGSAKALSLPRWSTAQFMALLVSSTLVFYWLCIGVVPNEEPLPSLGHLDGSQPKYFIAADLYNNEHLFPRWSREVLKLVEHLGPPNTFVSIYESNSKDSTPQLLREFADTLDELGVGNRILSDVTERSWPFNTSPQRVGFLANARNKALEPLQSPKDTIRLPNYDSFTKIVFLNDVYFSWDAAVRLLATSADGTPGEEGYDLACGMDFFQSGLYDTWVARDICGTPMRLVWPYVKDPVSQQLLSENRPFPVASCWNGMVAFPAGPYLYKPKASKEEEERPRHAKRGWKMIDNSTYADSRTSPSLSTPIQFRTSGIEACDHSECFLFSYDLHRLYDTPERPPRIIMNPNVIVAYSSKWYIWRTVILRIPVVQWWQRHWSHGIPLALVDWIWEPLTRRRDYCTWAALSKHAPERCPPLPGSINRSWNE